MRNGATLPELVVALVLMGVLTLWVLPKAAAARDMIAVQSARESLIASLGAARGWATLRGGATVVIVTDSAMVRIERPGLEPWLLPLGADQGVTIQSGAGGQVRLRFDRLGIGRFASRTVTITRGAAARSVSISSYGRTRRR